MGHFIENLETEKIELHFDKSEYLDLSDDLKKEIKSVCLFSKSRQAWVSRSKHNHYRAKSLASRLGLEDHGKEGESLSFAEQQERKQERAARRADRYSELSDKATARGEAYQQEFKECATDWSWLTQPIMAGHAGSQRFGRQRDRVIKKYEKGFEEFKKANYYADKEATANQTAEAPELKNPQFLQRRIEENRAIVKKINKRMEPITRAIKYGKTYKMVDGERTLVELTDDDIITLSSSCLNAVETMNKCLDKINFYTQHLEALGVETHNKEGLIKAKTGYIQYMGSIFPVKSINAKSVTVLNWHNISKWTWNVPYADITNIYPLDANIQIQDREGNIVKPTVVFKP